MKFCLLFNLSPCARYCLLIGSQLTTWSQGNLHYGRDPFNQNFRKFRSKTQWIGSVQPEKFQKTGLPFEVVLFSRSDRYEFWLNGSRPTFGRGRTVAFFFMSRHMLSHKYVTTFTPRESWRSHVWDINDI